MKTYTIEEIYDAIFSVYPNEFEDNLKRWDKNFPGLFNLYKRQEEQNKIKANSRIVEISKRLAELFDPVSLKECSICKKKQRGCCNDCYSSYAYFKKLNNLNAKRELISLQKKYGWNAYGFWSKTGCLLPREKRSFICQDYFCDEMSKHFTQTERDELYKLRNELKTIRSKYCVLL